MPPAGTIDPHLASERERTYQQRKHAMTAERTAKYEEISTDRGETGPVTVAGGAMATYVEHALPALAETDSPRADGTPKETRPAKPAPDAVRSYGENTRRASGHVANATVLPFLGSCADSGQKPITVFEGFRHTVKKNGKRNALMYKSTHEEEYKAVTWNEYYDESIKFAKALTGEWRR